MNPCRHIERRTITQEIYISEDGRETPVFEMGTNHLINAFGKACQEDNEQVKHSLKKEIIRRIAPTEL